MDIPTDLLFWLATCGIGAAIFHLLVPLILGVVDRGHNSMRQYISEIATPGRPYAKLVDLSFVIAGLLTIAFIPAVQYGFPASIWTWIVLVLLVIHGLGNVGAGIFPVDTKSIAGRVHTFVSQISSMGGAVTPFLVWLAIRRDGQWHAMSIFTLIMQAFLVIAFAAYSYVTETRKRETSKAVIGLFQRLYLGVYYTWFVILAIGLAGGFTP